MTSHSILDEIPDFAEALRKIEATLHAIPVPLLREQILSKLGELRELLVEKRNPRIALVGRRGAGKSSLINALFGEEVATVGHVQAETMANTWRTLRGENGALDILDTRGLQEGADERTVAREEVDDDPALRDLAQEFAKSPPDVILFLVKAKEADAGIDGDLARLQRLARSLAKAGISEVPVVGLVTQCDELEPKDVALHDADEEDPADLEEKQENVGAVIHLLQRRLQALDGVHLVTVMGVAAYMRWNKTGEIRRDERWNIDLLQQTFFDELPRTALYEFVKMARLRRLKIQLADTIGHAFAMAAVGIALMPLPLADTIPLLALQGGMILAVARLGNPQSSMGDVRDFLGALGVNVVVGLAARETFRTLVQLVPGFGTAVSGIVAWATTLALAKAATAYFLRNERDTKVLRRSFALDVKAFRKQAEEDPNLARVE